MLGTVNVVPNLLIIFTLMETIYFLETSKLTKTTLRNIPGYGIFLSVLWPASARGIRILGWIDVPPIKRSHSGLPAP
jgi:hypothetical protein